jgi:hypothetical protein
MKLKVEKAWAVKTWMIGMAFRIEDAGLALAVMSDRWPGWRCYLVHRFYWWLTDATHAMYCRAEAGSREEIEMAFEHADEDWLSPFQRMVVNERILPLPKNQLVEV